MTLADQIARLSKPTESTGPVVSVYLNTRWTDEHQRERTRLFLKGELRRARQGSLAEGLGSALDWIQTEAEALIAQADHAAAHGVALFAGPGGVPVIFDHEGVSKVVGDLAGRGADT
jgi:hypothetical protein